ncbi:arginine--tRNA ligase [Mycoplasmatota bacterium WC44]
MMNIRIESILSDAFKELGYGEDLGKVSKSNRPELCQFQCNDIFKVAKTLKMSPVIVGENVINQLKKLKNYNEIFKEVEFVPPGFINITLTDKFIASLLFKIKESENLLVDTVKDKTVVIDYGGANIAKPMHVGHLRSAVIGESIKRLYNFLGYKTISDAHLGDFGLQMGQVIYGLKIHGFAEDIYFDENYTGLYPEIPMFTIRDLQTIYPEISKKCKEEPDLREYIEQMTKELQEGRPGYNALFEHVYNVSLKDLKVGYGTLGVHFDLWYGERSSYPYIKPVEELLNKQNLLYESNGALIVDTQKETDNKIYPPLIFKKKNGGVLYGTTDLATIFQRIKDFDPYEIVYIVDKRQTMHFEQVIRVCEKSGLSKDTLLKHYGFGTMNGKDGKPFKTREGGALFLQDLFQIVRDELNRKKSDEHELSTEDENKILNSVIKFADLQSHRETDYIFDLDKFTEFTGKTGPYTLYTCVRVNKLITKVKEEYNFTCEITDEVYSSLERDLRLKLLDTYNILKLSFRDKSMHFVCEYVYDLCTLVNSLYQNNHLLSENNKDKVKAVTNLLELALLTITKMLYILGIEVPDKM